MHDIEFNGQLPFRNEIMLISTICGVASTCVPVLFYLFGNAPLLRILVPSILGLLLSNVVIYPWIFPFVEIIKNECLYKFINLQPPLFVYQLNRKFDNMYECHICSRPFIPPFFHYIKPHVYKDKNEETILKCGHRFHQECLREIELTNLVDGSLYYFQRYYKCFICNTRYDWKEKWVYKYMDINFDKMRDETLMTCLCLDIENKIIE
eukprot:UN00911